MTTAHEIMALQEEGWRRFGARWEEVQRQMIEAYRGPMLREIDRYLKAEVRRRWYELHRARRTFRRAQRSWLDNPHLTAEARAWLADRIINPPIVVDEVLNAMVGRFV